MTFLLNVFVLAGSTPFPKEAVGGYFMRKSLCQGCNAYDDGL